MMARLSNSRTLTSLGSGPSVKEMREFLAQLPVGVDESKTMIVLNKIPRDRPFDSESWSMTVRWEVPS